MVPVQHRSDGNGSRVRPAKAPDGAAIYAVGDIHGRLDLLTKLQAMILADAGKRQVDRRVVVYLGDYVDRGPDSKGVIDRLIERPLDGFESKFLKGNHEDFMLRFLGDGSLATSWMLNGGMATLRSYGVNVLDPTRDDDRLESARADLARALPSRHRRFLDGLELWHREGDYLFVHAGIRPGLPMEDQRASDLLWIRHEFLNSDADFGPVVVHGHTVVGEPETRANRIGIDTGAVMTGCLTALAMVGAERTFIQT